MQITPKIGDIFKLRNVSIFDENFALAGEHYSGKTKFATDHIVKKLIKANVKTWFWNHHGKFLDQFPEEMICYYLDELKNASQIYVPESKSIEHFNEFCKLVKQQRNMHVILDEIHDYVTAQSWKAKELQEIIRDLPSNQGITYTAIFQRANEVQSSILGNAKHKFLFKYSSKDQDTYIDLMNTKACLLLEKNKRKFYKSEPTCKKYSFLYIDDERVDESEFYDGGKFREVKEI